MTYNRNKSITHWTYKHEEYCLKNQIPRSSQLLWEWLLKTGKINTESEPDLKDFNNWIRKHRGKSYCRNTLKSAFNKLVECRVVNLVKQYTWNIVKIVTRPLEYLKPKRKLQKRNVFDTLGSSNPSKYDSRYSQQQHILITDNKLLFSQYGISFNDTETKVLDRPRNEVLLSIVCYQIRLETSEIRNPQGWIKRCLEGRYWDEPSMFNQIIAKYGNTPFIYELMPDTQ
ncbi:hypothetical protein IQ247_18125 [Plectonema cf. radiosum LEGE 06105]|uniref:Uncharacterized protein n=1 Tax=Plectonema cf. radiosum LEGE 06105 TaxID=945769 RepID=A0A8J7F3U1_9CYAN|nr:hypothetical protein [Plectonema radiosum]MBE9214562.1 hypothetical protein [Plectonema cf. radiosum LEGE 06105]